MSSVRQPSVRFERRISEYMWSPIQRRLPRSQLEELVQVIPVATLENFAVAEDLGGAHSTDLDVNQGAIRKYLEDRQIPVAGHKAGFESSRGTVFDSGTHGSRRKPGFRPPQMTRSKWSSHRSPSRKRQTTSV